jgi:hypothetical protein
MTLYLFVNVSKKRTKVLLFEGKAFAEGKKRLSNRTKKQNLLIYGDFVGEIAEE